jgi:hypothetical protein
MGDAKGAGKTAKAGKPAARQLAGAYGASFDGTDGYGNKVTGLTWTRRFTQPGVHPYD